MDIIEELVIIADHHRRWLRKHRNDWDEEASYHAIAWAVARWKARDLAKAECLAVVA